MPRVEADGLPSPMRSTKGPLYDADGRLVGLYGVSSELNEARDVERVRMEQVDHVALEARLEAIEGFSLKQALRNVGGRLNMVERVIGCFNDAYRDGVPELTVTGQPIDRHAWRRTCHSLRGACAAIGAQKAEAALSGLERALERPAEPAELEAAAQGLDHEIRSLVRTFEAALAPGPSRLDAEIPNAVGNVPSEG